MWGLWSACWWMAWWWFSDDLKCRFVDSFYFDSAEWGTNTSRVQGRISRSDTLFLLVNRMQDCSGRTVIPCQGVLLTKRLGTDYYLPNIKVAYTWQEMQIYFYWIGFNIIIFTANMHIFEFLSKQTRAEECVISAKYWNDPERYSYKLRAVHRREIKKSDVL